MHCKECSLSRWNHMDGYLTICSKINGSGLCGINISPDPFVIRESFKLGYYQVGSKLFWKSRQFETW